MSTAVTIFEAVIIGLSIIMLAAFGYMSLQFLLFFHWRKCNHCHHANDCQWMFTTGNITFHKEVLK